MWQLTEVVRSSQRIVAGAAAFQLGENRVQVTSQHNATGPPLKSFMFDLEGDPIKAYVQHTLRALDHVMTTFGSLVLHDRVAILVPDELFAAAFRDLFADELGIRWSSRPFTLISAQEAAASALPWAGARHKEGEWLVLDSVANFDGLERLIVIAVGLDAVIQGGSGTSTLETRSRLYRALTRAHMLAVVVNEFLPGGWLEFLGHVSLKKDEKFNRKEEMEKRMKRDAVNKLTEIAAKQAEKEEPTAAASIQDRIPSRSRSRSQLAAEGYAPTGSRDDSLAAKTADQSKAEAAAAAAKNATTEQAAAQKAAEEAAAAADDAAAEETALQKAAAERAAAAQPTCPSPRA